ncbi:hypothetical protein INR49_014670 [Caranx melampygus]|nr:hypothetical protein INR49_014670 [Caranx melampygus]
MDDQGKDTDPVSSEPSGAFQSQEKKCLNKIKVTHIRLPLTDRGEESSSIEVNTPVRGTSGGKDVEATPAPSEEQNQKKVSSERKRIPIRRPFPNGGYVRRPLPNKGPLQNRTRPNSRIFTRPPQPLHPEIETQKERTHPTSTVFTRPPQPLHPEIETQKERTHPTSTVFTHPPQPLHPEIETQKDPISPTDLPVTSSPPVSKESDPAEGTDPVKKDIEDRSRISVSNELNKTLSGGGSGVPSSRHPNTQAGFFRRTQLYGGPFQNRTRPNLRPPLQPHRHLIRKPHPGRKPNERVSLRQNGSTPGVPEKPSGEQDVPRPTQEVRVREAEEQETEEIIPSGQTEGHGTTTRPEINDLEKENGAPVSTGKDTAPTIRVTREPLDYVGVTNKTSDGFTVVWDSPEGKYKNFVVTKKQVRKPERPKQEERQQEERQDVNKKKEPTREPESGGNIEDENRVPERVVTQTSRAQSSTTVTPALESDKTSKEVLPGSARSIRFEDLPPQTEYVITLLGKGPGLLSRLHKLVISTGPEPPTNIIFSELTENSLTVSWTKPKSPVSGFKVTYTHTEEGEPVSVSLDSKESSLSLSQLSPGSTYEVNVISILGLDESDPIKDSAMTLPDPPTDLRAVNVTDTKALLLWRPALAAIDKYAIVYGSGTDSEVRITVSGNAAEQQLSGLKESTTYTVTITSSGKDGDGPRDLQAHDVTPRTALLTWKPPPKPAGSYKLIYETEGQGRKEVIVDASVTEYNLTRLHPGSKYTVELQVEGEGQHSTISTEFTTGTLRFPFPSDCSQEMLNGIKTSGVAEIYPRGKQGKPLRVYCDMETDGGGWTVFQRRKDGSVNFFRGWRDYIRGFGDLSGEFWLGLDSLHNLTTMTRMNLRVDLQDGSESVYAKYSTFEVANRNYKLTVGGYSGTAGDSLTYHNNRIFSTKDRDLAPFITRCAMSYRGGWWYKNCHEANLNGLYGIDVKHQGADPQPSAHQVANQIGSYQRPEPPGAPVYRCEPGRHLGQPVRREGLVLILLSKQMLGE